MLLELKFYSNPYNVAVLHQLDLSWFHAANLSGYPTDYQNAVVLKPLLLLLLEPNTSSRTSATKSKNLKNLGKCFFVFL